MRLGVLEENVLSLNPKNISLPRKVISALDLKVTLTLEKDLIVEERYLILISGSLIQPSLLYSDHNKSVAQQKYSEIVNDLKKGNYKVKVGIKLEISPETQLYPDIP